jgi:peptidoglycan endopeptidase LytE
MQPAPGEKIYLKTKAPVAPRTIDINTNQSTSGLYNKNIGSSLASNKGPIIHRVKPREGLYAIGRQYGVSINDLKQWNSLQSDDLQVGQEIKILQ